MVNENSKRETTRLPGRPIAASDIASARRWVERVIKKNDMDYSTKTNLEIAVSSLRYLEQKALQR